MNVETVLMGLLPSIGALLIFFLAVRGVIRADRRERAEIAREEAEEAARVGSRATGDAPGQGGAQADAEGDTAGTQ